MSKRHSRRPRNPNLPAEAFNNPAATRVPGAAAAGTTATTATTSKYTGKAVNWQAEYGEVIGDIRLTLLIAIAMVAVMVLLSFVIR
jgi:F0F1-type ATP synthase membrane subunit c/vacuolar-type H+-ATPase subunit K